MNKENENLNNEIRFDGGPDRQQSQAGKHIEIGDIVSGLDPAELVEVNRIAPFGSKTLVEGVGTQSRRVIKRPLADNELAGLVRVRGRVHTFTGDAQNFLHGVEAQRIRIAHQFDPLFAVNSSVVDPVPHQVEAVYRYLLPLPRIRFLLADDTGAGKTIMAGLLIKELRSAARSRRYSSLHPVATKNLIRLKTQVCPAYGTSGPMAGC